MMPPVVLEFSVTADGRIGPGPGLLAAFVPGLETQPALVIIGGDPRRELEKPIDELLGPAFAHIRATLELPADVRWATIDHWGRFFDAQPQWADPAAPAIELKRFANGAGADAFIRETGAVGEAGLELLSAILERAHDEPVAASGQEFLDRVADHGNLPAPGALFEAVSIAAVDGNVKAAVTALQTDPVICAILLNYANAAAFANARKTASLADAVQRLGMKQVRRVVFVAEIMARYQRGACPDFDYRGYWYNAIATGAAMRGLMPEFGIPASLADEGFTAGLLSGIGWLALAETFPSRVSEYLERIRDADPISKTRAQREIFPASLRQITETYLARFDFPDLIRNAISGARSDDGWAWFDCLAQAIRVAQGLSPFDCLAVPTHIAVPEPCREEWARWQALLTGY